MKTNQDSSRTVTGMAGKARHFAMLLMLLSPPVLAEGPSATPILEFATGLPGQQVRLSWAGSAGARYAVEKSTTLAADGWSRVAMVQATGPEVVWLDPEPIWEKVFYRISQPAISVFSISPPILSTSGGVLVVHGQCLPAGSFLVIQVPGQPPILVPLESLGNGDWQAVVTGTFAAGGQASVAGIQDGGGLTLLTLDQPLEITESGLASDGPAALPPAAPIPVFASKPVPRIGIVVKKNPGTPAARAGMGGEPEDCDDGNLDPDDEARSLLIGILSTKSYSAYQALAMEARRGGREECDDRNPTADGDALLAFWLSKKGYQYYMANSDLGASSRLKGHKHPDLMKREIGPGATLPAPSGLPGEVSFQTTDLALPCPAGPQLAWVRTYRSMKPVISGHGPQWDFSYNIWIEPIPSTAGASAPRVVVHDGGGRADVMHRQTDGTYRCDGMFREGAFDGEVFTLTFADKGKWVFHPLGSTPSAGKIATITDRFGVALACDYDATGRLLSVGDSFSPSRSLTVTWSPGGTISSVSDSSGRSVTYAHYAAGETGGSEGDLKNVTPLGFGPTTYTYSTGSTDDALNHNLLEIRDGENRLLEGFTYSPDASGISYDTCASHNRHQEHTGHVTLIKREWLPPGATPTGGYAIYETDEIGRVTETVCDALHRVVRLREFTGFWEPGTAAGSADLASPPYPKTRPSDEDFYETSASFNADHQCTRLTRPDGSQLRVTYDREFRPGGPVRERGNARTMTIRTASGQERTVSCDYLPGFGTPEPPARPGNPIGGISVKGGRNPGGNIGGTQRPGNPIGGLNIKGGQNPKRGDAALVWSPRSNFLDDDDDGDGYAAGGVGRKGWDGTIKGVKAWDGFVTRMVNAYGQSITREYDANGACTSVFITSLPAHGILYQNNERGQCTGVTVLNGPESSFRDEFVHDAATGFLSSVVCDKSSGGTGLQLTTTLHRDDLGRVTRLVDPMGSDWLYEYNSLDQCTRMQSPGPHRISVNLTFDNAGRVIRRDQDHLGADGLPVLANPSYSTFYRYDGRARLNQVADEERPVDGSSATTAAGLGIENFAVCDITRDPAGQIIRLSTPAACRNQSTDLVCDFVHDERGRLFRSIDGGAGASSRVTIQCDYFPDGSLARRALVGSGVPDSVETYGYDGFHRLASVTDAVGTLHELSYDNLGFTSGSVFSSPNPATGSGELMAHWRIRKRPEILFQAWDDAMGESLHSSAFFDYLVEDDTCIVDRFTPGSAGTPVVSETTIIDHSPVGLVQSVTINGDLLVTNEYDTARRLAVRRLFSASNEVLRVELTRDGRGNVLVCGQTDHFRGVGVPPSETFTHTFVRDSLGRVTQRTDGAGNAWSAAYDSFGRCVSYTIPGRSPLLYAYDGSSGIGPFAQQTSCDVAGTGTPEVLGSLLVRCGELKSTTDSFGHSLAISNDNLGRWVESLHADGTSESASYDSLGFVTGRSYRDGTTVGITNDPLGRVTEMAWPGNPATYQYDALGRCVQAAQGTTGVVFAYDSVGNPISETQIEVSSAPQVVSRTFNHRGRTGITYPDGTSFAESRDEFGNLLSVSAVGAPPASPPVVVMDYVGQRLWRSTQANGVVTVHNHRSNGETSPAGDSDASFDACVSTTVSRTGGEVISRGITRRAPDQSVIRTETTFADGSTAPGRGMDFTRDNLGRVTGCLTQVRATAGGAFTTESEVAYTLDLEGRRISEVRNSVAGYYFQENTLPPGDEQAGQYTIWPGGGLTWDDAGNLLTMQKGSSTLEFVHDIQGRVVACNTPGGGGLPPSPVAEFTYDALGRVMIHKIHRGDGLPSVETRFVYDGSVCIQELSSTGDLESTFVCVDGTPVLLQKSGEVHHIHASSPKAEEQCPGGRCVLTTLGCRMALLTNSGGAVSHRFDYDDTGKPLFLGADGVPSSDVGPIKWMAPEVLWVAETGMFHGPDGTYSPDLGHHVSRPKSSGPKLFLVGVGDVTP